VTTETGTQQPAGSDITEIRPFRVEISDAAIDDLRDRLARARWPEKEPVEDWSMGIPLAYVQELAAYWAESYDIRRVADLLNRYEQFTTTIDGVDIHFLHVRHTSKSFQDRRGWGVPRHWLRRSLMPSLTTMSR
jgi:hypothetical protein